MTPSLGVEGAQVEDGVGDELSGTVKGDIAAAIDLVDLDARAASSSRGGDDVGRRARCGPE